VFCHLIVVQRLVLKELLWIEKSIVNEKLSLYRGYYYKKKKNVELKKLRCREVIVVKRFAVERFSCISC